MDSLLRWLVTLVMWAGVFTQYWLVRRWALRRGENRDGVGAYIWSSQGLGHTLPGVAGMALGFMLLLASSGELNFALAAMLIGLSCVVAILATVTYALVFSRVLGRPRGQDEDSGSGGL